MKRTTIAAALLLTTSSFVCAQAPAEHDSHHPAQPGAAQAPTQAQPATPSGQAGAGGMPMMNMMGNNMPMHMMGMMRMMGMGGRGMEGMGGMATIDRVEGRIAFLRTELKVTDAQASAWNAFADALRANAKKLGEVRASVMQPAAGQQPQTLADRLEVQERWLQARLENTRAVKAAFTTLYGVLSDEQKKDANEILAPHMGMMSMMSGMQTGQMGAGQMGPGQTGPGRMQPGQTPPR
jgi:LTXXQ motif family protein